MKIEFNLKVEIVTKYLSANLLIPEEDYKLILLPNIAVFSHFLFSKIQLSWIKIKDDHKNDRKNKIIPYYLNFDRIYN